MLGIWYSIIETPRMKLKLQFKVSRKDGYTLDMAMQPITLPLLIDEVEVQGNTLKGTGNVFWKPDEAIRLHVTFEGNTFSGSIHLPMFGTYELKGERGRGPSLSASLQAEVAPYRKQGIVEPRSEAEIQALVEQLLERLTLQEKIGQMSQCQSSNFSFGGEIASDPPEKLVAEGRVGSILGAFDVRRVYELQKIAVEQSPHGIPLLFNADIIHGAQTIFPVPLAWSCSWDMEAIREACAIAAREATASGTVYNHGPMVDISRDPRWGRVVEGAGEDPYLAGLIAKAQVEGFQGRSKQSLHDKETLVACLKHFIGYGASEGGRDYNSVDLSETMLRNVYLPPFIAGIQADAASVMNAFNIYQGVPVAANVPLMKDLLRNELGFDGVLISDYGAIEEIVQHGQARDAAEAARKAVDATMDIEMVTRAFDHIPQLLEAGQLKASQIDDAVRRILTLKYKVGLMDDPFRYVRPEAEDELHFHKEHLEASRQLARKSIVLLKNDGVLPLSEAKSAARKLALIGPFADSKDLLGPWQFSRYGLETVTLYEGLAAKGYMPDQLLYAPGCGVNAPLSGGIDAALAQAKQADLVILALGESSEMSGEAASRMRISLPDAQLELAAAIAATGKPVMLVLTNGRPLELEWFDKHMNAIVETWFLGSQAGHAIADVLCGDFNPSGRLTMSFPVHGGQVPVYYNHFRTGRPVTQANTQQKFISKYIDGPNEPLYPFGYGLSYSRFAYGEVKLNANVMELDGSITASVNVSNVGSLAGIETVQLYIQDVCGSIVRPVKELKGFTRIELEPGENRNVTFEIAAADLIFWSPTAGYAAEPGEFRVMIGPDSRRAEQYEVFELIEVAKVTEGIGHA
ncbi:glycoside hydrolase family 3 N-terminal domain-containing protein [Paenibacillus sp. BC26]|uniref:glycoside hydrolase family 3 N-terminal domain-containing protein n=1 Tax=Paenibacillus sp. BC26 TaxID=1881032 RepID=UPI0008E460C1|nr:glycoside hydrolase family 3 N-terminal domain-containing protein [Paenibacillus sp. BC26]SFS54429.1 beta-glucosidase [Paenibacillus sp. BC26]